MIFQIKILFSVFQKETVDIRHCDQRCSVFGVHVQ